jgi:hypothetical protein
MVLFERMNNMSTTIMQASIPEVFTAISNRELSHFDTDKSAVEALCQAAVNVENFTIPLYLSAMSSIQGTHKISNSLANGRLWAGMSTTATPAGTVLTPNQLAYNTIFSVFIQEMLHLQLAANLATVLGVKPKFFEDTLLQNKAGGWGCFDPTNTTIPHIVDLTDTSSYAASKVCLGGLDQAQINLFLAIEQSHDAAVADLKPEALDKYFPAVPFADWTSSNTEADLPLFGTIGWMYNSLLKYLLMEYADGKTLWEKMFAVANLNQQRDVFNAKGTYHTKSEYSLMCTQIASSDPQVALFQAVEMISGISDQGEGSSINLIASITQHLRLKFEITDNSVSPIFQPSKTALEADYTADEADARATGDKIDHWQRFNNLNAVIQMPGFMNFAQWFSAGNAWTGADLQTSEYQANPALPSPDDVAAALNGLKESSAEELNSLILGAINGINTSLTLFWQGSLASFPNQAMRASGDRMSLYWAVMGAAPDIYTKGLVTTVSTKQSAATTKTVEDYHACQGLSLVNPGNDCAALAAFHTCSGSNLHKGEGGCGYPNKNTSGNYFAPSDNTCAQKGGCGAPISDWQLLSGPAGTMDILDIDTGKPIAPNTLAFTNNEKVYDAAWAAYTAIMEQKKTPVGTQPQANDLRIVLPPN